ncbi:MAG: ABC transporter permease [Lachnospiraceae bacterium]|jgi:ribose/xylose/arabinose/galactoside ABC-type transport system permease subunit|nr:ABC transporter permease [Lachnospiraceae bacterium]
MRATIRKHITDAMPFLILLLLVVVFGIATRGAIFARSNLLALFNQSVATIVGALGMMFVASIGGTDITHGALAAVAGAFAAMACASLGSWAAFPVAILIGAMSGAVLGFVNARLKVPSFMASLAMLIALRAYVGLVMSSNVVFATGIILDLKNFWVKLGITALLVAIIMFVMEKSRFGHYCKAIGENERAMQYAGINTALVKFFAFVVSGAMAGIASLYLVSRVGGASTAMGSGFEMQVMMAMFIGGIPVFGGMKTKTYKLILGAPMVIILENGLVICGTSGSVTQLVRGFVLLGAVYLMSAVQKRSEAA